METETLLALWSMRGDRVAGSMETMVMTSQTPCRGGQQSGY
ncbi:hypothetical protein [Thermogemmatispora sp.]|nr:hypothetical protein [Thermogemmatispora sp.]